MVELELAFGRHETSRYGGWQTWRPDDTKAKALVARLKKLHISRHRWQECRSSFRGERKGCWDMDHTIAVAEGGGSCGLDNLRTLCLRCHYQQTQRLRQRQKVRKRKLTSHELF